MQSHYAYIRRPLRDAYYTLSPVVQATLALNKPLGALLALHNDDGSALSRAVMISTTKRLLDQAGIMVLSDKGA